MKKSTSIVVLSTCLGLISSLPAYSNQNTPFSTSVVEYKYMPGSSGSGRTETPFQGRLPFVNTPKGVQDYANSIDWGRRKKVNFFDVGMYEGCEMRTYNGSHSRRIGGPFVICGGGYVEVSDPVETKVCELDSRIGLQYGAGDGDIYYKTERCSIK